MRLKQAAERLLETAAVKWGAAGLLHRSVAAFLAGFAGVTLWTRQLASRCSRWRRARRRRACRWRTCAAWRGAGCAAFEEQFPDCLEFISRSMRAGHAFSVALEMVHREFSDPLAAEFRRAFEEQNLGQPLEIVLRKLGQRVPSMDVQFFVSAVLLQKRTGGNLAELLDKLAHLIRERFKLRARIRAVSAQGLMSGRILSAIPMGVAALMFVANPGVRAVFHRRPGGPQAAGGGIGAAVRRVPDYSQDRDDRGVSVTVWSVVVFVLVAAGTAAAGMRAWAWRARALATAGARGRPCRRRHPFAGIGLARVDQPRRVDRAGLAEGPAAAEAAAAAGGLPRLRGRCGSSRGRGRSWRWCSGWPGSSRCGRRA